MKWFCDHQGLIAHAEAGWTSPCFQLQVTPFSWGVGICCYYKGKRKAITGQLGPIAFSVEITGWGMLSRSWPGNEYNTQTWKAGKGWDPSNEWFSDLDARITAVKAARDGR